MDVQMPQTLTLLPVTKRLRQLIAQHGDQWTQCAQPEPMPCFDRKTGVRIESLDGTHTRNVLFSHTDF